MRAALGVIAAAWVFASGCARPDWIEQTLVTVDVTGVWRADHLWRGSHGTHASTERSQGEWAGQT